VRKLTADAALVFGSDAAARALGFLAAAYAARVLGREGYGVTIIGIAFLSYVLWFADLGLGTLGTREMSKGEGARQHGPGEILSARLTLSLLVVIPAAVAALLLYHNEPERSVVLLYILTALPYGVLLEWYFQGIGHYTPLLLSRTLTAAINVAGLWLLVSGPEEIARVPVIYAVSYLLPALLLLCFRRPQDQQLPHPVAPQRALATLRHAGRIGFGSILAQTVQLLPPLVLGFISTAATGTLGAATRIAFLLLIVDRAVGALYLPRMAHLLHSNRTAAAHAATAALRICLAAGGAIVVGTAVAADQAVSIIYPGEFADAGLPLALLGLFVALTLVNSVATYALIADRRERDWLQATVVGAVGTGVFALVLIVVFPLGAAGAAAAMVGGELLLTVLTWRTAHEVIPIPLPGPILHALFLSILVGAAAWLLDVRGVIAGIVAALALLVLGIATRLVGVAMLRTIRSEEPQG